MASLTHRATVAFHAMQRARWMAMARAKARLATASLVLDVHPTARIHPGVALSLTHGSENRVVIGPGCRLEDDVLLVLDGGTIELGPECELRRRTILHVAGDLRFSGGNILSWGCTVHCGERVELGELAGASEYVTIADSRHFHTTEDRFFYHNSQTAPVRIGRNVWLAAKATILPGTVIGDHAVVGCNSVVSGTVPRATLVAGAPARAIRPTLPLPAAVRPA
jgi:acetyltransferase-like isoleucine patch superfamily enzyme